MGIHRLNHAFTAGELSPLMNARKDFDRHKNGCKVLKNMVCQTQGPATRRPGLNFIYDLVSLGMDITDPRVREIPFIFDEDDAYAMIFFMHTDGFPHIVFASGTGLVVYPDPPPTECPTGTAISPAVSAGDIVSLALDATWDIENFDWAQSADEMYIAQEGLAPRVITRFSHYCWALSTVGFTSSPTDWTATSDWPEKVTFHQQRLVFGANTLRRQTIWMSEAGDFLNMATVSSPAEDHEPVSFTLDSGTQNRIQWMQSGKSLHVGTLGDEWTVTGSTRNALTPSNILAQRQTNNGSESNTPLMIGLTVLFVERHGRVVNEFVYDYTYDSYKTSDLAILSPHLTEKYSIVDWTYQQTPDSILWAVRSDGELLGITYQRQHKVVGWHRHETEGEFKAVTSIPGESREDDIWVVVKREVEGVDSYFIEKFVDMFTGDLASESHFLDSHVVYDSTPLQVIPGVDHLIAETVTILADGTVHPPVVVDASGQVTLNNEYSYVVIGLPFTSEVRPYLMDLPTNTGVDTGTAMGRMQRITRVDIDLYKSLGMSVGSYSRENGEVSEDISFREPSDLTGTEVPLFTGIYHWAFPEGFDRDSEYFIRQEQPLPLTIRGVVDTVEVFE